MAPAQRPTLARAEIVDRDGVTLAQSATFDRLDAHPRDIPADRRADIVETLAGILDLERPSRQAYLAKLSTDAGLGLAGAPSHAQSSRSRSRSPRTRASCPASASSPSRRASTRATAARAGPRLASHLLGFVAGDSGGAYGVERLYEDRLAGTRRRSVAAWPASPASAPTSACRRAGLDGLERATTPAHHRRPAPAAARERAEHGPHRRTRQERQRHRHGPLHGRHPGLGLRARLRRQRLRQPSPRMTWSCCATASSATSTSRARS